MIRWATAVLVFFQIFFYKLPSAYSCVVGYGYAATTISSARQEQVLKGVRYGLKKYFENFYQSQGKNFKPEHDCQDYSKINFIVEREKSSQDLGALKVLKKLMAREPVVLAGFSTSHEASLIIPEVARSNLAVFLPGPLSTKLLSYSPYFYSSSPGRHKYVERVYQMTRDYHRNVVVLRSDDAYSMDAVEALKKKISKQESKEYLFLDLSHEASTEEVVKKIREFGAKLVYFTLYPEASQALFEELIFKGPKDLTFLVSSSWESLSTEVYKDIPPTARPRVYLFSGISNLDFQQHAGSFVSLFKKDYGVVPEPEAFGGFKVGYMLGLTLTEAKAATKDAILKSLQENHCTKPVGTYTLCRESTGFSNSKVRKYRWTVKGFSTKDRVLEDNF